MQPQPIQTTLSFHALGVKARMNLLNDIKRLTSEKAKDSARLALLWVNTALDAHRVGAATDAKTYLGKARAHIKTAMITEQYSVLFPITMSKEKEGVN